MVSGSRPWPGLRVCESQWQNKGLAIRQPLLSSTLSWPDLETGRRRGAHFAEAITAVDRPVAPGPERHHCVVAALGAIYWVHLFGAILVHTGRPLLGPAHCPTTTAAFGLVTEPPCLEKFLFSRRKDEFPATLHAS